MTSISHPINLDRQIKFVDMILATSVGEETIENAADLLTEIEQRHGLKIISINNFYEAEEDATNEWCVKSLFPFLSETHLVITGGDLLPYCQIYDLQNKQEKSFSWREWGHWMARWANKFWLPRPQGLGETHWTRKNRNWNYLDFYERGYLNYQIENYDVWADTIIQVIYKKTEMQK